MTGIIKNCKSANIGGVTVFTYEGAEAAYRALSARVYSDLTMEASVALGDVADVKHGCEDDILFICEVISICVRPSMKAPLN